MGKLDRAPRYSGPLVDSFFLGVHADAAVDVFEGAKRREGFGVHVAKVAMCIDEVRAVRCLGTAQTLAAVLGDVGDYQHVLNPLEAFALVERDVCAVG